jgi:hypothetical protein
MATQVTPATTPTVSSKLLTLVKSFVAMTVKINGLLWDIAGMCKDEANRQGLDRDGCNALVQAAFAAARGADKMQSEDKTTASKVLAIAWAKEPANEAEMAIVREHNRANPKARVGFNAALEVSRGNRKAADVIEGKKAPRNNASSTPSERAASTLGAFFVNHRIGQSKSVSFADADKLWKAEFAKAEKAHNAKLRADAPATESK